MTSAGVELLIERRSLPNGEGLWREEKNEGEVFGEENL
jgi:hypothetical protein